MWILTMRSPVGEPREFVLRPGKTTLGRKSDNDIHLLDASASRFHAEIHYDPQANTITIHDLGSMNGSFVNHERLVEPRPLNPDDEIRIGEHIITLAMQVEESGQRERDAERHTVQQLCQMGVVGSDGRLEIVQGGLDFRDLEPEHRREVFAA